jgi:hypothetical protein
MLRVAIGLVLGLAAPAFLPAAAAAQPPAEKAAPGAPPAPPGAAERPHLWWNDSSLIEQLELKADQRAKMDGAYEKFRSAATTRGAQAARSAFEAALREGKWSEARKQLDAWMDQQGAPVRAFGELKIEVLSLLSDGQRKKLYAELPRLVQAPWRPRVSWASEAQPPRKSPK